MAGTATTTTFIASLDVGTTSIRCHVIDSAGRVVATATDAVKLLYPKRGYVEIDPEVLWQSSKKVVEEAIQRAGLRPAQITALGVSTQRSTFVTWDRRTGKPFHNFITWKDVRADSLVRQWNNSLTWRSLRLGARCLYAVTGSKRFLAGSVLKLMNTQVTCRFSWALTNVAELKEAVAQRQAAFGTVDTWLMYKMTAGRCHVTDVSSASATGFYDPFTMSWAAWALGIFGIPEHALPTVGDSAGALGESDPSVWGCAIPIRSLVADQSAAVFGACCFKPELIKVTMGTGTFVNINTAGKPHASVKGLYPVVGWRVRSDAKAELVYLVEGASSDTANIVNWGQSMGLYDDPAQSSAMAEAVASSDGICFVPAFSGLQAPVNDYQAAAGFLGIKPTARKEHMVRAMLESLAYRVVQLLRAVDEETSCTYTRIRVDGGVSRNDFVCQLLADLSRMPVERSTNSEMSAMGAAYLAGIAAGVWRDQAEVAGLRRVERVFEPRDADVADDARAGMALWEKAVGRFLDWYPADDPPASPSSPPSPSTAATSRAGGDAS